jgi:hypothetical protein
VESHEQGHDGFSLDAEALVHPQAEPDEVALHSACSLPRALEVSGRACSYFKTEKDSRQPSNALDSIVINSSFNIVELDDVKGKYGFEVDLPHRAYYLYAESEADRQRWMDAIKKLKDL